MSAIQGKELPSGDIGCGWVAGCFDPASLVVAHPVLGLVACCDACVSRFVLDVVGELVSGQ